MPCRVILISVRLRLGVHGMHNSPHKLSAIVAIAMLSAATFAGCTSTRSTATSSPTPPVTATSSTPTPSVTLATLKTGQQVAVGDVISHDRRESAHVAITVGTGGSFVVTLSNVQNARQGEIDVALATNRFTYGQPCFDAGPRTELGALNSRASQSLTLVPDFQTIDPSYLHSLVFSDGPPDNTKCLGNAVGAANLSWTMPNMRPDLLAVDDGTRPGATGMTTTITGRLTSYVSVKGDRVAAIAARFGLSVPDLLYLNPNALQDVGGLAVQAGSRVNLSTATR